MLRLRTLLFLIGTLFISGTSVAGAPTIALRGDGTLPFTLSDNRILVTVQLNGHGPYRFVFDTGGANILDPLVAHDLGLTLENDGEAAGAGAERQQAWRTHVALAELGGAAIHDHEFRVISLEAIRNAIGFERFDGIVGRELFERFVVDIDYDRSRLTFVEPKAWKPSPNFGPALTLGYVDGIPAVHAVVDSLPGRFIIDTGDRSSLTLFGPFVKRHGLRTKFARTMRAVTGWGVGGPIPADVVRVPRFEFGGSTVSGVVTRMPLLERGGFATSEAAGSVGTGVLKRFRTVFDYSRNRMFLAPDAAFAAPDPADRSGLWLVLADGGFKVMSVVTGSPADQCGVRVDDIITAVDGVAVTKLSLIDFRDRLKTAAPGTTVRLTIGGRDVRIVLRDMI